MERMQPQGEPTWGQIPPKQAMNSNHTPDSQSALNQQKALPREEQKTLPHIGVADLPPPPAPAGLDRVVHTLFGGLLVPLHVLWPLMRVLWLALGLVVIGAVGVDYLKSLLSGQLPGVTEAFSTSPLLQAPARYPVYFIAGTAVFLLFTVLAWGAAQEYRRLLNARAEQVRQAIRAGIQVEQLDEQASSMLAAGDAAGTFLLATQVHEQNRPQDAVALYHLVIKQAPRHFGAHYNLSLLFAESEQWERAEEYCRATILLNAESAEAQGLMGFVLYRLGYLEEAQRRARLAVRMGFPSGMLEMLIKPGLGVTSSLPAVSATDKGDV
jgi:hypothetical protein